MFRLVFVLCGGMFLDGYILGVIGPVIDTISKDLAFSALWEGLIGVAALFGIFIGSPLGGWAGDKFGRKPSLLPRLLVLQRDVQHADGHLPG